MLMFTHDGPTPTGRPQMSDSSGAIDSCFDMPPGKRMSSERRFEKNTEYERGRFGVRAHFSF